MDGVEIRLFGEGDSIEGLTDLLHRAYAELGRLGLNYTAVDQDAVVTHRRIEGRECRVALLGGAFVGTVTLARERPRDVPDLWDGVPVAYLSQFAVDPALRGRGIGRLLLDRSEERARELGFAAVALDTAAPAEHLVRIYAARGYREVGRMRWRGKVYESVILSKPLDPPEVA